VSIVSISNLNTDFDGLMIGMGLDGSGEATNGCGVPGTYIHFRAGKNNWDKTVQVQIFFGNKNTAATVKKFRTQWTSAGWSSWADL